jgi:hypothetical protein
MQAMYNKTCWYGKCPTKSLRLGLGSLSSLAKAFVIFIPQRFCHKQLFRFFLHFLARADAFCRAFAIPDYNTSMHSMR